jgi:hypothetical protein
MNSVHGMTTREKYHLRNHWLQSQVPLELPVKRRSLGSNTLAQRRLIYLWALPSVFKPSKMRMTWKTSVNGDLLFSRVVEIRMVLVACEAPGDQVLLMAVHS